MDDTKPAQESVYYLKQTLFSSSLVSQYLHNFNVRVSRFGDSRYKNIPNDGLNGIVQKRMMTSFLWQELTEPTESMDTFMEEEDDEINEGLSSTKVVGESQNQDTAQKHQNTHEKLSEQENTNNDRYIYVDIEIHPTSISLSRGKEFNLHCRILSAAVLPGCRQSKGEDSLILILESQLLLIIRIHATEKGNLEPIIVQRLSLAQDANDDELTQLGFQVTCNNSGTLISASAFSKVVKLFKVDYDNDYIPKVLESMNILIEGMILKQCFIPSTASTYAAMLCLVLNDSNILELQLHELGVGDQFTKFLIKSFSVTLSVKFELPDFMVPLPRTGGILFIQRSQISVKGINFFFSRESLESQTLTYPHDSTNTSASSYYIPKSRITCLSCEEYDDSNVIMDQVLISYKSHAMFLLDVFYTKRKAEWKLRFNKLFTQKSLYSFFSLEEITDRQYELSYFNDNGVTMNKLISLAPQKKGRVGFACNVLNEERHRANWHPLYDFIIVPPLHSKYCDFLTNQELWCLGRKSQKSALFHLHIGLAATSECISTEFKGSKRLFKYEEQGKLFYVASSPLHSIVSHYNPTSFDEDSDDDISTIVDICNNFYVSKQTIHFGQLEEDRFVQIFSDGWRIGRFSGGKCFNVLKSPFRIILASSTTRFIALAYEKFNENKLMVSIECFEIDHESNAKPVLLSLPTDILGQPSMLEFADFNLRSILAVGLTNGEIIFLEWNRSKVCFSFLSRFNLNSRSHFCITPTIPYSLRTIDESRFLITTMDGLCFVVETDLHLKQFNVLSRLKLGHGRINVARVADKTFILACGSLWKMNCCRSYYPTEVVENGWSRKYYWDCLPAPLNNENRIDNFAGEVETFLTLGRNGLNRLFLSDTKLVRTEKVRLGMTGIKLEYYKFLRVFIILPSSISSSCHDKLIFIDHKSRKVLSSNLSAISLFEKEEYPVSLFEWKVDSKSSKSKVHHLLLIGCRKNNHGSIKIVEMKKAPGTINLRLLNSWKEDSPIFALNQLKDSAIVYGCGDFLRMKKYDPIACHMGVTVTIGRLLSNIKSIVVTQRSGIEEVIVNTERDSFSRFLLGANGNIKASQPDFVSRCLSANLVIHNSSLDNSFITIADKQYTHILSLKLTDHNALWNSSAIEAQTRVPYIPRLMACDFSPIWMKDNDTPKKNYTVLGKFLSVGLSGEATLFTLVQGNTVEKLCKQQRIQFEESMHERFLPLQKFIPSNIGDHSSVRADDINAVNADIALDNQFLLKNCDIAQLLNSSLI